jgi:hypothetical protein
MLERYWPEAAQVNACIKNEAETADVAVLLAVHQPSPLSTRDVGSSLLSTVSEEELLAAFLTDNVPGGALLFPITGASGAGKSHMIRWLDAQLQRSAKRDRLHIIRIPKSASLRTVVEKILDPLKDNPLYAKARGELTRAVAEVNVDEAVLTFRAHLEFALGEIAARLEPECREHPERADLRLKLAHARDLPKLFGDAALAKHFADNVLSRIVQRALKGRSETSSEEDDRKSQFVPEDLRLPADVDLGQAAMAVRSYFQRNLDTADQAKLRVPIDLLNEAIDPAIGNVFHLQHSTGGMTLQDIILAVRETLLQEDKDLVLLVEDFAALSGIQDVLLKVCIQEGEYEGKKVRATMRTAIALTDGVLSFRDTVFTRAQREWIVGGREMSETQIKDAAVNLVGAYMNAARWGETELRRLFKTNDAEAGKDWLPIWRDDDDDDRAQSLRDAFGYSSSGAPLFPFNRQAISVMAQAHLTRNGSLVFNPRKIINDILRSTLLLRRLYEAKAFPSVDQKGFTPNANLADWIRRTNQSEAIRKRLGAFLAVWGGNPADEAGLAQLAPGTFEAFALPTPAQLDNIGFVGPSGAVQPSFQPQDQDRATSGRAPEAAPAGGAIAASADPWTVKWSAVLDAWAGGEPLVQGDARAIRNALYPLLEKAMEWPRIRVRKRAISATSISIPEARGNPPPRRAIHVCESSSDEDGRIRAGLLGALRFEQRNQGWTYPGADNDYVASAAIVDHLVAQVELMVSEDVELQVRTLAQGLLAQSRIAGLAPPLKQGNVKATLSGLFGNLPVHSRQEFDENWERLRDAAWGQLGGRPARELLQSDLQGLLSSFQGSSGATPYALDSVRLLESLEGSDTEDSRAENLGPDIIVYLKQLSDRRVWPQLQPVIGRLREFRSELADYVKGDFDKARFVRDLEEVASLLITTSTWPQYADLNPRDFERRLTEFKTAPISELVEKATIVAEATQDQLPKVLNALGTLDLLNVHRAKSFLATVESLIEVAQAGVDRAYALSDQANPDRIAGEIDGLLTNIIGGPATVAGAGRSGAPS